MSVTVIRNDAEALAAAVRLAPQIRKGAVARDRDRQSLRAEVEALSQSGLTAISVPRAHGGAEVSAVTIAEVFRMLSAADPSLGQIPQNHFCFMPVVGLGTAEQAAFFYGRFLAGERIGNAHSENSKRRAGEYEHRLERVDGGWRITGRKFYSTGALFAHWIPFIGHDAQQRQLMFFADAKDPGVTVIDDWEGMGQRLTASGTTVFENVFIPDFHVFPYYRTAEPTRPIRLAAALIHAAIDLGIAEEALGDAKAYILDHCRPWIENPLPEHAEEPFVIRDFGKLGVQVRGAARVLMHAAAQVDAAWANRTPEPALNAALALADARIVCAEAALAVADGFFPLTGARATLARYGLDRHWRNARTHSLHDPLRWKEFHLGNYYLNGVEPGPRSLI